MTFYLPVTAKMKPEIPTTMPMNPRNDDTPKPIHKPTDPFLERESDT
jgi:hypothetical protein